MAVFFIFCGLLCAVAAVQDEIATMRAHRAWLASLPEIEAIPLDLGWLIPAEYRR